MTLSPHRLQMSDGSYHSDNLHEKWTSCLQLPWCCTGWNDDEREPGRELIHVDGQQIPVRLQGHEIVLAHRCHAGACCKCSFTRTKARHGDIPNSFLLTWPAMSMGFSARRRRGMVACEKILIFVWRTTRSSWTFPLCRRVQ